MAALGFWKCKAAGGISLCDQAMVSKKIVLGYGGRKLKLEIGRTPDSKPWHAVLLNESEECV